MNIEYLKWKILSAKRYAECSIADHVRSFKGEEQNYIQPCFWCRLGNLMFQLATCYAHGLRHGIEVRAEWNQNVHTRNFRRMLGASANMFPTCTPTHKVAYREPSFSYTPIPASVRSGILEGFFQSYKYFKDYEDEIYRLYLPFIAQKKSNTLGICIRLGDYKQHSDKYNLMGTEWLKIALSEFSIQNKELVLFSDEPKLALPILHEALGTNKMNICMYEGGPEVQLRYMSSMENLIISASSFHWWGAYLGRCEKVVAPAKWFLSEISDYQDIYLPHWNRI